MTLEAPADVVDLFAGPGGLDVALAELGLRSVGVELDDDACATRAAAGHRTVQADVAALDPTRFAGVVGLVGSPPCQGFSKAGSRKGMDDLSRLTRHVRSCAERWTPPDESAPWTDPRSTLGLEPLRWIHALRPRWVALEQVPAVLPLWKAYAAALPALGYSCWAGVLNAADYGVPQTRERAVLMARLGPKNWLAPEPTHHRYGGAGRKRWVSMAEAIRPGSDPWAVNTGRDWKKGGTRADAQTIPATEPAPALTGKSGGQWHIVPTELPDWCSTRPATTIAGDPRCWPPGHKVNGSDIARLGEAAARERYGDRAGTDAVRLTVPEALVLQTFPADYPVQGGSSSQFQQVGNAVPPMLAAAIIDALT